MLLTEKAHELVQQHLQAGQVAIDATAGNGYDCCFLARQVGSTGKVFAFDIQQQALDSSTRLLQEQGLEKQVQLFLLGHEQLKKQLPDEYHAVVKAVMFNLGYLPLGDRNLTTARTTTLEGLRQAQAVLHPHGIITVLAYRGHPGGAEETEAVEQILQTMSGTGLHLSRFDSPGPILFALASQKHV
jgi:predicted methyltransferase